MRRYGVIKVKPLKTNFFTSGELGFVVFYYYRVGHGSFHEYVTNIQATDEFDAYQRMMHKLRAKEVVSVRQAMREKRRLIRQQTKATRGKAE